MMSKIVGQKFYICGMLCKLQEMIEEPQSKVLLINDRLPTM